MFMTRLRDSELRTSRQQMGDWGEILVAKTCSCPNCKRSGTHKLLPSNFKCADVICDFCGYLTQVKTAKVRNIDEIPGYVLGGAWGPQKERMSSAIFFSLYLVLATENRKTYSIFYLSRDLQEEQMFVARKPLSDKARRAGWQGFKMDFEEMTERFVRLM